MNAEQVRALVAAKYPTAHSTPLAQFFARTVASDAADQVIEFAQLRAKASKATEMALANRKGATT